MKTREHVFNCNNCKHKYFEKNQLRKESLNIDGHHHTIGGVFVSVLASCAVDRGFEKRSGYSKALRRKSKDWSARNQNNVSGWNNISIRGLLLQ